MKYIFMIGVAFCLAIFSSVLTALGMMELFATAGMLILILFIVIDLGRFLLFNFIVDDWKNLRGVKYAIGIILILLFAYSAVGIYSKLDSLITPETRQAMINAASYNKAADNAELKQSRSEDLVKIAQAEYDTAIKWNSLDYTNCITRAQKAQDIPVAENRCNNTKRKLDKTALTNLQKVINSADTNLDTTAATIKDNSQNTSEIASVLTTLCKVTGGECDTYDGLQNALTLLIFLVIAGTDYLQIAIILAVNTRKNKPIEIKKPDIMPIIIEKETSIKKVVVEENCPVEKTTEEPKLKSKKDTDKKIKKKEEFSEYLSIK